VGKGKPLLFYHPGGTQFFFDEVVKYGLVLPYPCRQLLFDDLPDAVFTLHSEHDPVAAVITHIYGKHSFRQAIRFAEVELSQAAIGFYQLGKLDIPDKLYLHKAPFELNLDNSFAQFSAGSVQAS
jgi:hypothetical protein